MKTNHRWMLAALCLLASAHSYAQQNMELTQKQQALAAIAAHEAKGDLEALKRSLNDGFQQGLTLSQAKEALSQLYAYTGFPRSLNALGALQQVVSQRAAAGLTTEAGREADPLPAEAAAPAYLSVWPRGEKNPYGQYFIGQSYLADLGAVMNVTFEPRCRNNWHVHHKQVQVLICVAGRGWYQEWGKPAVPLTPGTVIAIPAEAKHWHGAARDSWLQHLTYHKDVQQGASNEWLEPVDDEWYDKLE